MIMTVMGKRADGTMDIAEVETGNPQETINRHQMYFREQLQTSTPVFGVILGGKK